MSPKNPTPNHSPSTPDLKPLPRETLENLLADLYEKFDNVMDFIDIRMSGNSEPLVKKFKKLIKNRLIEDIEDGTDGLYSALQGVRDFSGYGTSPRYQADIMLYFVETAVYCMNDYGDLYAEFYVETDSMFVETLKFTKKHQLLIEFRQRCKTIVDESENTGYGFHDSIGDTYYTYFPEGKSRKKVIREKPVIKKLAKKPKPIKPDKK